MAEEMITSILEFFDSRQLYYAMIALEQDSGIRRCSYGREIDFFYELMITGRHDDALRFVMPLGKKQGFNVVVCQSEIKRQQFLEEIEGSDEPDVERLSALLKDIESLVDKEEFNTLWYLLSLDKLRDHPDYAKWNIHTGRYTCFMRCLTELRKFYEIPPNQPCKTNLTTLFNMSQDKENKSGAQDLARTQFFGKMPQVPQLQASMDQVAFQKMRASQQFLTSKVINEPPEAKTPAPQRQEEVKVPAETLPKEEVKPASPVPEAPVEEKPASPKPSTPVEEKFEIPEPQTPEEESKSPTEALEQSQATPQSEESSMDQLIQTLKDEESPQVKATPMDLFTPAQLTEVARITDTQPIRACCFHGDAFAIGTNSKSLKICSLENVVARITEDKTEASIQVIHEKTNVHFGSIYCVDWSNDGSLVASGSNDVQIHILKLSEYEYGEGFILQGHIATVRCLAFDAVSTQLLVSGGIDQGLKVWDVEKAQLSNVLHGHSGAIHGICNAGPSNFISVGTDRVARVWDLRQQAEAMTLEGQVAEMNYVSYSNALNQAAIAHMDGLISLWDLRTAKMANSFHYHNLDCRSVEFSPDSRWLASASFDHTLGFTNLETEETTQIVKHNDRVVSCKWHGSLPILISTSADRTARVFCT